MHKYIENTPNKIHIKITCAHVSLIWMKICRQKNIVFFLLERKMEQNIEMEKKNVNTQLYNILFIVEIVLFDFWEFVLVCHSKSQRIFWGLTCDRSEHILLVWMNETAYEICMKMWCYQSNWNSFEWKSMKRRYCPIHC